MRDCETLRDDLKAFLDGELPIVRRTAFRLHLARCASCREEMKAMEQIGKELRAGETGELGSTLRAKLLSGIPEGAADTPAAAPAKRDRFARWRRRSMILWGATAAACLLWVVFKANNSLQQANGPVAKGKAMMRQSMDANKEAAALSSSAASMAQEAMPSSPPAASAEGMIGGAASAPANSMMGGMPGEMPADSATKARKLEGKDTGLFGYSDNSGRVEEVLANGNRRVTRIGSSGLGGRQVNKQANITVEVGKLEESSDNVEQMVKTAGGYVASNQLSTDEYGAKSASLTVRVPVAGFEAFLNKIAKLGEVKAKSVNGEDITEQISDEKQARRALQGEIQDAEDRLKEARSKSQRREDQDSVRDLRIQAAQTEGRLELLKKMATLATITVQLHEKSKAPAVQPHGGFMDDMSDTARAAAQSFVQAARLPILLLIWLVAYAPVWILLLLAYRYIIRT